MKTAEQWQAEQPPGNTVSVETIQAIQLDAWKQGVFTAMHYMLARAEHDCLTTIEVASLLSELEPLLNVGPTP